MPSGEVQEQDTKPSRFHTQAARETTWGQFWRNTFETDGRTIFITVLAVILMNVPYVKWAMYPFTVYSTWIHELCHGLAAIMAGGEIIKLEIFSDTSGLATYQLPTSADGDDRKPFVTSAGYQGTAMIGMLLLVIRRTKRGPRAGTMALGLFMVISVALWVRNAFGIAFLLAMGILLMLSSWFFTSTWIRNLYVFLAVTCALNAITAVKVLFGDSGQVNGQDVASDAESMAEITKGSRMMWALIWLFMALGLSLLGFLVAIPAPGKSADFTLCGMCQDCGCFYLCNLEGKRLWSTLFGKKEKEDDGTSNDHAV